MSEDAPAMISQLLQLFTSLENSRKAQRDKLIAFLEEVSAELVALSDAWNETAALLEHKPAPGAELLVCRRKQRRSYGALVRFRKEVPSIDGELNSILDSALDEKSNLYYLTEYLDRKPGEILECQRLTHAPSLKARVSIIAEIQERAASLSEISGQFRAAVAVVKSKTSFI